MNPTETPGPTGDPYSAAANALVVAGSDAAAREMVAALDAAGVRLRARIGFAEAAAELDGHVAIDLIAIEAVGAPDALLEALLVRADTLARERRLCVVATVAPEQIDAAAAHLFGPATQLLCQPGMADRAAALAIARIQAERLARGARVQSRAQGARRDPELEPLQRLSEDVARIADALARLTRGEEAEPATLREPGSSYRGPDEGDPPEATAQEIRAVIRARRLRGQFFRADLFADPAWDMLLDLYAAHLERRRVSVSSLCIAAAVPPTTALRWIGSLHDAGLFERQADLSDRRRAYIALSPNGLEGMRGFFSAVKRQGLALG